MVVETVVADAVSPGLERFGRRARRQYGHPGRDRHKHLPSGRECRSDQFGDSLSFDGLGTTTNLYVGPPDVETVRGSLEDTGFERDGSVNGVDIYVWPGSNTAIAIGVGSNAVVSTDFTYVDADMSVVGAVEAMASDRWTAVSPAVGTAFEAGAPGEALFVRENPPNFATVDGAVAEGFSWRLGTDEIAFEPDWEEAESRESEIPTVSFSFECDDDANILTIQHGGGDSIDATKPYVRGSGFTSVDGADQTAAGDSAEVGATAAYTIRLVFEPSDDIEYGTLAEFEGPDA